MYLTHQRIAASVVMLTLFTGCTALGLPTNAPINYDKAQTTNSLFGFAIREIEPDKKYFVEFIGSRGNTKDEVIGFVRRKAFELCKSTPRLEDIHHSVILGREREMRWGGPGAPTTALWVSPGVVIPVQGIQRDSVYYDRIIGIFDC